MAMIILKQKLLFGLQELKAKLEAQEHRRCIKSHTPFDGIPYDPSVTYISIYRHPIDVHFSTITHVEHMTFDIPDDMLKYKVKKDKKQIKSILWYTCMNLLKMLDDNYCLHSISIFLKMVIN